MDVDAGLLVQQVVVGGLLLVHVVDGDLLLVPGAWAWDSVVNEVPMPFWHLRRCALAGAEHAEQHGKVEG